MSECAIGKGANCVGDCFSCCVHRVMAERDALKEQVARLEKRVIHWAAMNALREKGNDRLYRKLEAARAECDRLRAALETYGRHDAGCAQSGLEFKLRAEDYPCSCGFSEALSPPAAPAPAAVPPRAPGG